MAEQKKEFGLEFIRELRPCRWRYVAALDDGREHFGFVAQDVDEIAPKAEYGFVSVGEDGVYLKLNLFEFIGPIVKAIQELDERIKRIEEQNGSTQKTTE